MISDELRRRIAEAHERAKRVTKLVSTPEFKAMLERIERAKARVATMDFDEISRRAAEAADRIAKSYSKSRGSSQAD